MGTNIINMLTIDEIIKLLKSTPEQAAFDWKVDFLEPADDERRGEIIKDLSAIANASPLSYGFLFYGVDPRRPDPLVGISTHYDDAKLQQLVAGKIDPPVDFLYYEVSTGPKTLAVIQVAPSHRRPHIISVDIGKIRRGQIVIRRGSATDGVTLKDLFEFFYGKTSGYFPNVIQQLRAHTEQQLADIAYMRELREQEKQILRDMEIAVGFPPGYFEGK